MHLKSKKFLCRNNTLNGNACAAVLKKLDDLAENVPLELLPYVDALSAFDVVRKACFGQELLDSYKEDIIFFKEAWLKLDIDMFLKMHILLDHVPDFCERHGAMGYYSEQTW